MPAPTPRSIELPLFRTGSTTVYGGPSRECPKGWFFVKLAREIRMPCDVDLPIDDFSTPFPADLLQAVEQTLPALRASMNGGPNVYVGCMGGIGRTGMFIAALVKTSMARPVIPLGPGFFWRDGDGQVAIDRTRSGFRSGAIETDAQETLIRDLQTVEVARRAWEL